MLFTTNSVCSWKLRSIPEYHFNKQIKIDIETTSSVQCYVANGHDIATSDTYYECTAGKSYTVDADQHVFIVVQGTATGAYMQFSY